MSAPVSTVLPPKAYTRLKTCLQRLWPQEVVEAVLRRARVEIGTRRSRWLCRVLGAMAVTLGNRIYVGQMPPDATAWAALLAHELTHVRQWGNTPQDRTRFLLRYVAAWLAMAWRVLWERPRQGTPRRGFWARFRGRLYDPIHGHWAEREAVQVETACRKMWAAAAMEPRGGSQTVGET